MLRYEWGGIFWTGKAVIDDITGLLGEK